LPEKGTFHKNELRPVTEKIYAEYFVGLLKEVSNKGIRETEKYVIVLRIVHK